MLTDRIAQALALAVEAHDGQKRKGTQIPYIAHPMGVASIALEHGADEEQAMAALLHDAVEDGGPEYALRIREQFGPRVADIVQGCTDGVTYRREHIYVRVSVLSKGELFLRGLGPEFGLEEWFQDDCTEGNPAETRLPQEGYAALLHQVSANHLNAIAEYLVDGEQTPPRGIREDMQRLYNAAEIARRQADKAWEKQENRREAERQLSNPKWDPQSLHFIEHDEKLTLRLLSPAREFIWTASVAFPPEGLNSSIALSKGNKVPSPLLYVPVSKATVEVPFHITQDNAETTLRELFTSGWLTQQMEHLK